jgi:valyl-tRNA synthetase
MGHGFQHTLMDALIRYHRMQGHSTLWQPGTDHAGISTQMVVENRLHAQGKSRKDFTREEFIDEIWKWKEQSGNQIYQQMKHMGASADWSRERFTMDDNLSFAVQKVFIQLYDEGLIYRGNRLVNWDPKLGTAVSDLEVIAEEEDGFLWHIRYRLENSDDSLVVATTRPETLLGDVAVAVHPEDERYRDWIGRQVHLPLCDRFIPIIGDEHVDPAFGTGCVKVTPAHDFNDYQIGKRHDLPLITIMTKKGTINKHAPVAYQGMAVLKAREQILKDLNDQHLLVKTEPHRLKVPRGEKSNAIIEPLLTDQWYVKIEPLAQPAREAVASGAVQFVPENWNKTYFQWMNNLEDWCISRQLWWGHRIPAWYDNQGRVYVGYNEADVRFKYRIQDEVALNQDEDVLDTWFSSALWPFTTLGWPELTPELKKFYPTSVLVTGFDIIFFWVARMMMMGLKFMGQVPFKKILITGLIRDSEGHKMSKSKGNVLDPMDIVHGITLEELIQKRTANLMLTSQADRIKKQTQKEFPQGIPAFGTDALRMTYCALANHGRNIRFDLQRVEGYRNFCNKLWNAARFVLQNLEEDQKDWGDEAIQYSPADQWIRACLQQVIADTHRHYQEYRLDRLANCLYEFVWHTYCDWYIEFSKTTLYDPNARAAQKRGTKETLTDVLETILKLLHPIMPFITEEINLHLSQCIGKEHDALIVSSYPAIEHAWVNEALIEEFAWLKEVIQAVRTIRSEMGVSPSIQVPLLLKHAHGTTQKRIMHTQACLINLCRLSQIQYLEAQDTAPPSASAMVGDLELLIPLEGFIDVEAELKRLQKELIKLDKDITFVASKLNNPQFTSRAPEEIIAKEKEKLAQAQLSYQKLMEHKKFIEQMVP